MTKLPPNNQTSLQVASPPPPSIIQKMWKFITFVKINASSYDVYDLIEACHTATAMSYRFIDGPDNLKILKGFAMFPVIDIVQLSERFPGFMWHELYDPRVPRTIPDQETASRASETKEEERQF